MTTDRTHAEVPQADSGSPDASEDTLQRERDELLERLLRTTADFDNYRKRVERERRELFDAAAGDVVRDLLPIIDDFDRALAAPPTSDNALRRGVELIHRRLLDVLRSRGVEPFESVGEMFNPAWHEAVATEPRGAHRDGEIVAELRRGYRMHERLLRPAQVKVAQS